MDFTTILPDSAYLKRLFINSNWAHQPSEYPESEFRARQHVPALAFRTPDEQKHVVDKIIDSVLSSVKGYRREHLKAIEWSITEITDNVLMHSNCADGDTPAFIETECQAYRIYCG
jgi:hypothetical protein